MAAVVASKVSRARKEKTAKLQQEKENLERDPNDITRAEAYIAKQKKTLLQGGKEQPKRFRPNSDGKFEAGNPGENVILYIGLGMICIGLVIMCVGLGDKGFKTLELKLVGPVFIGIGMFFTLLRILICTMPESWKNCFKCCCNNSEEREKLIKKESQKFKGLSENDGKDSRMKGKQGKRIVINNNININFQNNTNINYQNTKNGGIKMSGKPSSHPNHPSQAKPIKQSKPNHPVFISDEDLMTVAELSIDSFKSNSSMGRPIKFNKVGAEDSTTVSCSSISDDNRPNDDQEYHDDNHLSEDNHQLDVNPGTIHKTAQIEGSRVNINSAEIVINASKLSTSETSQQV